MIRRTWLPVLVALAATCVSGPLVCQEDVPSTDNDAIQTSNEQQNRKTIRLSVAYGAYSMEEFNTKLRLENNNTVDSGISLALEFSVGELKNAEKIPFIGSSIAKLLPNVGIEYLNASSKTTHTDGVTTTVNWHLPVLGIYFAPELVLEKRPWSYLRPLVIGYYRLTDAGLTLSGHPGRLAVSAGTLGVSSQVGAKQRFSEKYEGFIEAGYRWLKFRDVHQTSEGDFLPLPPGTPAGNLPQSLDYSGLTVRAGIVGHF